MEQSGPHPCLWFLFSILQAPPAKLKARQHVMEALVEGYEQRIETLALPDPDDRHVLAAAIESRSPLQMN